MTTETIIALIAAFGAGFSIGFAVNVVIKFDINEWQKRRDANREIKLKNLCPHVYIFLDSGKVIMRCLFYPYGTVGWRCNQCHQTSPTNPFKDYEKSFNRDPTQFVKEIEKDQMAFEKFAKKMGRI